MVGGSVVVVVVDVVVVGVVVEGVVVVGVVVVVGAVENVGGRVVDSVDVL